MGADIAERSAAARAVFDQADAQLGFALSELCFGGPADTLTATENAQPALLTVSTALLAAARELAAGELAQPAFVAGHSLGEYSALVAAGVLSFADALRLVRRRGELMAAASEGTMAAIIGLELDVLREVCRAASEDGVVVVANENSPGQLVISGSSAGVQHAMALAREHGARRAMLLNVAAAFHSPLMEQAARGLRQALGQVEAFSTARSVVVSNVTAEPLGEAHAVSDELVAQVTAPVRWIASVHYMVDAGVTRFVEIGPGNVLAGLIKRITPGVEVVGVSDWDSLTAWVEAEIR
jgi:[acyl-carrier-protein] S-malonyltransferase